MTVYIYIYICVSESGTNNRQYEIYVDGLIEKSHLCVEYVNTATGSVVIPVSIKSSNLTLERLRVKIQIWEC